MVYKTIALPTELRRHNYIKNKKSHHKKRIKPSKIFYLLTHQQHNHVQNSKDSNSIYCLWDKDNKKKLHICQYQTYSKVTKKKKHPLERNNLNTFLLYYWSINCWICSLIIVCFENTTLFSPLVFSVVLF